MPWAISVILLIMVAVIILANLGKAAQENQRRTPRPMPPRNEDEIQSNPQSISAPRTTRTPAEVERFLEEVNRRRLEAAERRRHTAEAGRKPPPPPVPVSVAMPASKPPITPPPLPPSPPLPATPASVREPVVLQERQEQKPPPLPRRVVEREVVVKVVPETARAVPTPAKGAPPASAPPHVAPKVIRRPISAQAISLREMLRDAKSLRVAVMLREVLDPPLALRARRR